MIEVVAIAAIGVAAGFAMTVWLIIGVTSLRLHQRAAASAYVALATANLSLAVLVFALLADHPVSVAPTVTSLILTTVIVVPAVLHLRSWRTSKIMIHEIRNNGHE